MTPRTGILPLLLVAACPEPSSTVPTKPGAAGAPACRPTGRVEGKLAKDTRWCGRVLVAGTVLVPEGVTLTVEPGAVVRFKPYRGYQSPERRLQLRVHGRLVALGRPGKLIRFTSDAPSPRNGDWSMVKLMGANGSRIGHAVFEFAQHGLNIWRTDVELAHVVIRFNNWEGLYVESHCAVAVRDSRIYANGYNCIAVERFTRLRVERSYIGRCGTLGIHVDASRAEIRGNLIEGEGLSLDNDAQATVVANRFTGCRGSAVSCGEGKNRVRIGGNVIEGVGGERTDGCAKDAVERITPAEDEAAPRHLSAGVNEGRGPFLDYIPGDRRHDKYRYVYPERDATRRVTRRLGGKLGLTWSLAWDGASLWTANLAGEILQLDPGDGRVLKRLEAPGPQSWGMTFGRPGGVATLWINDFARRRIYALDPKRGVVRRELAAPDPKGGCKGLAWDGRHLWVLGWATHLLYRLDPESGKVLSTVRAPWRDLGAGVRRYVAGGLTWDGEAFWAPSDRLIRFDAKGRVLGWVHGTSERVWDLAWDGKALWTTQRANENWADVPRIYRVELGKLRTD
jgi:hypothetical protein